jgi:excisionase family DNA binding protein
MTERPSLLRAGELAKLFNLSERTIRRRIADGTFTTVKVGGARLVPMALLDPRLRLAVGVSDVSLDRAQI